MSTMLKGRYVIGWDDDDFVIYRNGQVVYEGDTITYVGTGFVGQCEEVIDCGDAIISPGMIDLNALGDIDHHLIFSDVPAAKVPNFYWSANYFENHRQEEMSPADEAFKSRFAYANLIMNGTTTAMPITSTIYKRNGETFAEIAAAAHHAADLGLRIYLGPSFLQGKHVRDCATGRQAVRMFAADETAAGLANAEKFIKEFEGAADGLIRTCVVPERIELQTEAGIVGSKELAKAYGVPIRMHAAQGLFEYELIKSEHGTSPIAYLDSLGFFDEHTLLPHAHVASGYSGIEDKSDRDLDILRDRAVSVIHCPIVLARSGTALESFGRYIRHGINMCMGSDGWPADIITNCKVGSIAARMVDDNKPENYFDHFFRAATIGGARALGRDDLGKLAPGCKADIVVFDQSRIEYGVQFDPIQSLFNNGSGMFVSMSVINGRVVMRDRVIAGADHAELLARAQIVHDNMAASYKKRSADPAVTDEEFFHTTFPLRD